MRKFYDLSLSPIVFISSLLLILSCKPNKEEHSLSMPNIVWINVEDINPALGCYGDPNAITPNLDKLASEGVVYRNAYSTAPICAPSRSSFVTGVYSTSMGTQNLRSRVDRPDFIKTLPEHLKEAGYFVTNYAKTDWNFSAEGVFDYWKQDLAPWRQRPVDQPFYSTFVVGGTHEGSANNQDSYIKQIDGLPEEKYHDPEGFPVPGVYPETPHFQKMWARYYDLITRMDMIVGEILGNLEEDGLKEETVVFFFADHGFGMPRFKRYLFHSGIHVPLLVYLPEKYQHWSKVPKGESTEQLVSLVDLAPSVLNMLGLDKPEYMQGQAFIGKEPEAAREFIYAERSRADDLFEMSRAIFDRQYMYVRNYMPHLPYIRDGRIQGPEKDSYRELIRMNQTGELPEAMDRMFDPKPVEELYDLKADPWELKNVAADPVHSSRIEGLRNNLHQWSLDTRDIGFLTEAEYMIRAEGSTPYELAQDQNTYDIESIMEVASLVGHQDEEAILNQMSQSESMKVYWAIIASQNLESVSQPMINALKASLQNTSVSTQIAAAEALCRLGECQDALPVLEKWVLDDRPWVALQAARSVVEIGAEAKPIVPTLLEAQKKHLGGEGSTRKYKDFEYASFAGWALETALENCGEIPL
ncbi:MAG: sulfatase-like hydrolase/transferase [Cyclobacteriaceae bacterium]